MWPIKESFRKAIRQEHQQASRVTFLDSNFDPVSSNAILESCFCHASSRNVTNFVSDGNVDVDVTRLTRRTAELTILNPTRKFTPRKTKERDTDNSNETDPELVGYVYLNRLVRLERGIHISAKQHIYVPIGTFMIDIAEIIVERNMSVVVLTMSDLGKKLAKSYFGGDTPTGTVTYPDGTRYTKIIKDLISDAGIPLTGKMQANIDELESRTLAQKTIKKKLKFERGESRGERLKELCDKWDIDIYFDPMGRFIAQDRRENKEPVWEFRSSADGTGMLVSVKRSLSDDSLYNHVIVIGTGNKKGIVRAERKNENPSSPTSISEIGDRVYYLESENISDQSEAISARDRAWKLRLQLEETVTCETVCMPALEGNDVVRIYENDHAFIFDPKDKNLGKKYRLRRFNVPLVTSRQTIEANDMITPDEL